MTEKLVIIGNGMAPGRMLEHLLEAAPDRYQVTIFNAEPRVNYDRIMLSPVLSGEKAFEEIVIHGDGWYIKHGIMLYKGHKIVAIDREAKTVTSDHGVTEPYDRLVIATGSVPFIIPVPGKDLPGVLTYRDLDDVNAMLLAAQSRSKAVVIGGGLLGLEAAAGLKEQGMDVTVLHVMPTLMERQLDPAAGYLLQKAVEARGIKVITKANTKAIVGNGKVEGVELADGEIIPATLVVMAVGIRPNVGLAKDAGLEVNRGIVTDDRMQTSDPAIFALGECAEVGGHVYGLVAPLYEMARVAAARLADGEDKRFVHSDTPTKLKVTGIDLYSIGDFADGDDREEIILRDASAGIYKRVILQDNKIIGTVLFGETGDGAWFNDLKKKQTDISEMRDTLIFGQAFQGGSPTDPLPAVAALADDAEICGCNGVCKGKITSTITAKGLTGLDDVRAHTKASASCGSCTGLVEKLLTLTLGDSYNPAAVQPMCSCTTLGHDDVRRLIKAKGLKTIPVGHAGAGVEDLLRLRQMPSGAELLPHRRLAGRICRRLPVALHQRARPRQHPEGRHLFRRAAHVGRHDLVEGTARHRRCRRQVRHPGRQGHRRPAHRHAGHQEGGPARGLGRSRQGRLRLRPRLRQGPAHGENLRRHRLVPLRHAGFDRPRHPHREIHVGLVDAGQGQDGGVRLPAQLRRGHLQGCRRGLRGLRATRSISPAPPASTSRAPRCSGWCQTEDEALEVIVALTQMYREQARYLERIYKWAKRVGVAEIKRQVLDDVERRKAFFERFVFSQKFAQVDPWSERVSGKDKHEFQPMAATGFPQAAE